MAGKSFFEAHQGLLGSALQFFLNDSNDYAFILDRNCVYQAVSKTVADLVGCSSSEQLIGKTDFDIFPKELAKKYRDDDEAVLSGKTIDGLIEEIPSSDGLRRWTKTWKKPVFDDSGKVIGIYGMSRDVTSQIINETEAKRLLDLIENLPGGVGIMHCEGNDFYLDYANEGCFQAQCNTRENWKNSMNAKILDVIYPPDRQAVVQEYLRVAKDPKGIGNVDYRVTGQDGKLHWINIRFRPAYRKDGLNYWYSSYTNLDEQKKAEDDLRVSQSMLVDAIGHSDVQFFTYYPNTHKMDICALNTRFKDIPQHWSDYPEDMLAFFAADESEKDKYRAMVQAVDGGKGEAECVCTFSLHGLPFWEKIHLTAVRDETGHLIREQGYSLNVSAEKKAQEAYDKELLSLRDINTDTATSKAHHNLTQNTVMEYEGTTDFVSRNYSGMSYDEVFQRFCSIIRDNHEQEDFLALFSRQNLLSAYHRGETHFSYRFRRKPNAENPGWVLVEATLLSSSITGDIECFVYTYDVTEKVLNETIVGNLKVFGYDDMGFLFLESGACLAYVYDHKEKCDKKTTGNYDSMNESLLNMMVPYEQRDEVRQAMSRDNLRQQLQAAPLYTFAFTIVLPNGEHREREINYAWQDAKSQVIFFWVRDITDRIAREKKQINELTLAKKKADQASLAKSDFLSRMSHDMRTPLNGIIGMTYIAKEEKNPPKTRDCLDKIDSSSKSLLGIVNDVLDMAKAESGKLEFHPQPYPTAEFAAYFDAMIRPLATSRDQSLTLTLPNNQPELVPMVDKLAINRIFFNLLFNSIKYTPAGGKIDFSIVFSETKTHQIHGVITVKDNGIGMSEAFQKVIFQPFVQEVRNESSESHGTGLGLAIVKRLVDLMGGTIQVKSKLGQGTTFVVTLDFPKASGSVVFGITVKTDYHSLFGKNVLLCEDNELNVMIAKTLLEQRQIAVTVAVDGEDGLEHFIASKPYAFDAILMDIRMPKMNGYQATQAIRSLDRPDAKKVPIIAMTADAFAEDVQKAKDVGMDAHLSKPFDPETLFHTLSVVMKEKSMKK
jgi:PAS domain S-box-containing protein